MIDPFNVLPELFMTIGPPGCGKTTSAQALGIPVFSSDAIREELGLDPTKKEDNNKVFNELHKRIIETIKSGQSAVYDATNMSRKKRMSFLKQLNGIPVKKVAVVFSTPIDICVKRDSQRERTVGKDVIHRMICSFNAPWVYEGWDSIVCVPNDVAFLYPTEDMDQKNSHHTASLNEHQWMAEELAYNKGYGAFVQQAAAYHDIGKRITQSIGEDGEAHYYSHHNAGAYMYLSGFNELTTEDLYVANLINWHMAPYMEWKQSEKRMNEDRAMMGEMMFSDIMRLHECDVEAH